MVIIICSVYMMHITGLQNDKYTLTFLFFALLFLKSFCQNPLKGLVNFACLKWNATLVRPIETPYWDARMKRHFGPPIWNAMLGRQNGTPPWSSHLGRHIKTPEWNARRGWGPAKPARASQTGTFTFIPLTWLQLHMFHICNILHLKHRADLIIVKVWPMFCF